MNPCPHNKSSETALLHGCCIMIVVQQDHIARIEEPEPMDRELEELLAEFNEEEG